jgi:hypothetical protein
MCSPPRPCLGPVVETAMASVVIVATAGAGGDLPPLVALALALREGGLPPPSSSRNAGQQVWSISTVWFAPKFASSVSPRSRAGPSPRASVPVAVACLDSYFPLYLKVVQPWWDV